MNVRIVPLIALAASAALAQTATPTTYARAYYLKIKPGKAAEHAELRKITPKGAAAYIESGRFTGYASLRRVFPASGEVGHDLLYFYTNSKPPEFDAVPDDRFPKALGMTREQWTARSSSLSDVVKTEIWTNVYVHGSMKTGDFVRVDYVDPPLGERAGFLTFEREYESKMRANLVRRGDIEGSHMWALSALTPESAPYNFVSFTLRKDAESLFKSFGSQAQAFAEAFPGRSYNTYYEQYRELRSSRTVKTVVYRVDTAIWK